MSKMQQAFGFAIEKIRVDKREIPLDLSESFLNDQAILNRELIPDGAHPGIKGYAAWQTGMEPTLLKLLDAD